MKNGSKGTIPLTEVFKQPFPVKFKNTGKNRYYNADLDIHSGPFIVE